MPSGPMVLRRTRGPIEQSNPETYHVVVLRGEALRRVGSATEVTYGPGELHVNDSALPFRLGTHGANPISRIGVEVPEVLLPSPLGTTTATAPSTAGVSAGTAWVPGPERLRQELPRGQHARLARVRVRRVRGRLVRCG